MVVDVSHIDTCLACYLTDHHNRDGELLIGVQADGAMTNAEVLESVSEEFGRDLGLVCATCGHVIREPDDEEPDDEEPDDASPADDGGLDFDALARIGRNWQD